LENPNPHVIITPIESSSGNPIAGAKEETAVPWKKCPHCGGFSYSAATNYDEWLCPYCQKDIASTPDCSPSSASNPPEEALKSTAGK